MRVCLLGLGVEPPLLPDERYAMVEAKYAIPFVTAVAEMFQRLTRAVAYVTKIDCWGCDCLLPPYESVEEVVEKRILARIQHNGFAFTEVADAWAHSDRRMKDATVEFFHSLREGIPVSQVHVRWTGTPPGSFRRHASAAVPVHAWKSEAEIRGEPIPPYFPNLFLPKT